MANELTLRAEPREIVGKKVGRLRREGRIPGVVYGPVVKDAISVSVDTRDFQRFFSRVGHTTIFNLEWSEESQPVLIREVQVDPLRRDPLHVDFFAPNMRVKLRQAVPVYLHGLSDDAEGLLQQIANEVEVEALPADLPHQFELDISSLLHVGDQVLVSSISVPAGVDLITDGDSLVASLVAQRVEEVDEPEAEVAEGEEPEAAEEGEAEATEESDSE